MSKKKKERIREGSEERNNTIQNGKEKRISKETYKAKIEIIKRKGQQKKK